MPTIKVIIKKGKTSIKAEGFTGSACTDATAGLEKALGVVKAQVFTAEYYESGNTVDTSAS
jgi:hypothetical protein